MRVGFSRFAAIAVAGTLTFGGIGSVNAFAAYSDAPTTPKTANEINSANVVTATAHRAASPLPEMLGANTPSGFGMINGSAPTSLEDAQGSLALTVWGSNWNENPDPYWWNYYYNFTQPDTSKVANALLNPGVSGSPVMADKTLNAAYGNISVSLSTRPNVAIGVSTNNSVTDTHGYDDQIATIRSLATDSPYYVAGDENYNPYLVPYNSTTLDTMITTTYTAAAYLMQTGKATRYADTPVQIATDYENYIKGIKGYIKQQIGSSNFKTIAIVSGVTTTDGVNTYTIDGQGSTSATSTNRYVEYTNDVTNNLTSSASATVSSSDLAGVDAIIITSDALEATIKADTIITNGESAPELISIDKMDNLYGVRMNSVENALGMGYILARIYDDDAAVLNARYIYEYFASKFYHIKSDKLNDLYDEAILNNFSEGDIESSDLHDTDTAYSENVESALKTLFASNARYY